MATKKAATKKPCKLLRINSDGSITPNSLKLKTNECIRLRSPEGFSVDIKLVITLKAGGGGPITIHS
jgi:hypothetical protein